LNTPTAPELPPELSAQWARIRDRLGELQGRVAGVGPQLIATLPKVAACSDFVVAVLERQPQQLLERLADRAPLSASVLSQQMDLCGCAGEAEAMGVLRRIRNREMAWIAWQDLSGAATLEQSLAALSLLADSAIRAAEAFAVAALEPRYGRVVAPDGTPLPLLILGMGKLGGGELNFSSDIDLVLLYPDGGSLSAEAGIDVEEYFRKLGQIIIRLLDQRTDDGFVFRVDTRLRPFGASGPLVVSLAAFEAYLVRHGRDWERYAYIKARLITGLEFQRELFEETLIPFVYRRYLDYGVFEALREMKALIGKEVARRDMADNIKLGPGGIREIEFIVQALQLVRGGRDPRLRERSLLTVLPLLADAGQLSAQATAELDGAYRFLRQLENYIQAIGDQQTHELPTDTLDRARVAHAMGAADWNDLAAQIAARRGTVEGWFREMALDSGRGAPPPSAEASWATAWQTGDFGEVLEEYRLGDSSELVATLHGFSQSSLYQRMDETSRRRLAAVISRIATLLAEADEPAELLKRVLPVLQAIGRRSAYLALLMENPAALERLMTLARHSEFLVKQVAVHPMLLDELLDPRVLETPPSRSELELMLEQAMRGAPAGDVELRLDHLRQFQRTAVFRIAIADRFGHLPLMKVSDRLTDTAEIVLGFSLAMARDELVQKYGRPMCGTPDARREAGFIIVAYGKLGGLELGYGSDLDIVFLHDSSGPDQETDGIASVDNARFFVRLAQRLIHYLSIQTSSGRLYEVDTRLRPSGESGMLVSSIETFRRYQREQAWVWEHQALLRSRSIAGSTGLRDVFEAERREILVHHVDRGELKAEVKKMRERMRTDLSESKAGQFDLKQDPGGLADIEFLVDYWVLDRAPQFPELIEFPDNIRQLEALGRAGLVPADRCRRLIEIYIRIRERLHELALDDRGRVVDAGELDAERAWVTEVWNEQFAG
jgi:glutamate-ammonia-ligase adenylyltransferase